MPNTKPHPYEAEFHFTNRDPEWYECGKVFFKDSTVILRCLRYTGHDGPCSLQEVERTSTSEKF